MKSARFAALGAALVFGISTAAAAQPPVAGNRPAISDSTRAHRRGRGAGREFGGRGGQAFLRGITLTDVQRTQLRSIHEKYGQERRTLLGQLRGQDGQRQRPDSAQRAKVRSLMERQLTEVRGILTADQQKTFDQNVATMRDRSNRGRGRRAGQ